MSSFTDKENIGLISRLSNLEKVAKWTLIAIMSDSYVQICTAYLLLSFGDLFFPYKIPSIAWAVIHPQELARRSSVLPVVVEALELVLLRTRIQHSLLFLMEKKDHR